MIQSPFLFDKLINRVLPLFLSMSFSPRKNLFDSSFHAVFLNYLFFFFYLVIAWYPVVFFWFAGGLKCWSCSFMKEGVLAFGTQLHSRIKFEAVCVLGTTRRLPALRRPSSKKIQSISKCQRGSCFEESPPPKMFPFSTFNCRRYRSCRKANTYHKSIKNKNKNAFAGKTVRLLG